MKTIFRIMLVAILGMLVGGFFLPENGSRFGIETSELASLTRASFVRYGNMVDSLLWMGGIAVAALIGSVVGLWFFWNPARYIFVLAYLLVMGLSGCPLGGLREQNSQWYDWYLNAIEVVIVVLLTASMWTKPLRKLFQKSSVSSKAT